MPTPCRKTGHIIIAVQPVGRPNGFKDEERYISILYRDLTSPKRDISTGNVEVSEIYNRDNKAQFGLRIISWISSICSYVRTEKKKFPDKEIVRSRPRSERKSGVYQD